MRTIKQIVGGRPTIGTVYSFVRGITFRNADGRLYFCFANRSIEKTRRIIEISYSAYVIIFDSVMDIYVLYVFVNVTRTSNSRVAGIKRYVLTSEQSFDSALSHGSGELKSFLLARTAPTSHPHYGRNVAEPIMMPGVP